MVRERGAARAGEPLRASRRIHRDQSAVRTAAAAQPCSAVASCPRDVSLGTYAPCGAVGDVVNAARRLALALVALAMPAVAQEGNQPQPTVVLPLDDGSFLYFLRTIPLEVGKEYSFDRYFRPDRNPVRIQVLRRERVSVPAGQFDAVVVRPIINAKGVFSENG